MSEAERCEQCGGRLDRPGLFGCDEESHPRPTQAQRIVRAVEHELDDRRGMGWSSLDDDVADELRDKLAAIVEVILEDKP